ncbi:nucleotide kinase [Mycobacterium phage MyraDee]|uniref:DUF3310 domain-containing protein n=1 Tax=Mycobacterium phage MyraDee TaxID=2024303 RepID=A0A222YY07_9CAUD|nr:nucleotide kinase [Mycobacterium phage MyraDee]ASR77159.1 hypothetical protein SEA_MYRADEE_51 [Mycobacterium phage MyraDee]
MTDLVNHPPHYADGWSNGAELIDITENLNFNRGNAVKYTARAGKKDPEKELEDLRKAEFYIQREIRRLGGYVEQDWERNVVAFPIGTADFFLQHLSQPVQPRVWNSLNDVPDDVVVEDSDRDRWKVTDEGVFVSWAVWDDDEITGHDNWREAISDCGRDGYAPFTEVL